MGLAAGLLNSLAALPLASVGQSEPAIGAALGAPPDRELWMAEALMVAAACALPLTPWLLETLGERRLVRICLALYAVSALLAAGSSSLSSLATWLFVHGLAAAPLFALTQALVTREFPERVRGLGMALWNGGGVLGVLLGSLGAAWAGPEWRWIFVLGLPALLLGAALVPSPPPLAAGRSSSFDWLGFQLMVGGTLCFSYALSVVAELPPGDPRWVMLALGPACAVGYVLHARRTERPLVSLEPLSHRVTLAAVALVAALNALCSGAIETNFVASQLPLDGTGLALRTMLVAGASFLGVAWGGALVRRGLPAAFAVSLAVCLTGKLGFPFFAPGASQALLVGAPAVSSLGFWMTATVLATAASGGAATAALFGLATQLGGALGLGALSVFYQEQTRAVGLQAAYARVTWLEWGVTALLLAAVSRLRRETR